MEFLRVLSRYGSWPREGHKDWTEEAIEDLTRDRELSLYRVEDERALKIVAVAFSCGRSKPRHLDVVRVPSGLLQHPELHLECTPDNTQLRFQFARERHHDLTGMTREIARHIVEAMVHSGKLAMRIRKSQIQNWARTIREKQWPEVSKEEWAGAPDWLMLS